jgi:hypothetical protein
MKSSQAKTNKNNPKSKVLLGVIAGVVIVPLLIILAFNWSNVRMFMSVVLFGSDYLLEYVDEIYKADSSNRYSEDTREELYCRAMDDKGQWGPPVGSKTRAVIAYKYAAFLSNMKRYKDALPILKEAEKACQAVIPSDSIKANTLLVACDLKLGQPDQALVDGAFGLDLINKNKISDKVLKLAFLDKLCVANLEANKLEQDNKISSEVLSELKIDKSEPTHNSRLALVQAAALATAASLKALNKDYPKSLEDMEKSSDLLDKSFNAASPYFEENLTLYVRSLYRAGLVKEADLYNKKLDDEIDGSQLVPAEFKHGSTDSPASKLSHT